MRCKDLILCFEPFPPSTARRGREDAGQGADRRGRKHGVHLLLGLGLGLGLALLVRELLRVCRSVRV